MRLRGRITFKVLTLVLVGGILLIVCLNYFTKHDEFLIELPPVHEADSQEEPVRAAHAQATQLTLTKLNPSQLLNLTNFQYALPNDLCRKHDKELLAILIVTSYVGHDDLRAAHRQAISQSRLAEMGFQRIFLLAQIPPAERFISQAQLQNEQQLFGDLLQGNFQEAYRNLSYKHVMGLRWAATECTRAKFIVKIDDDIVYDVFQLRRHLEALEVLQSKPNAAKTLLAGFVEKSMKPYRNSQSKWYVSREEYPAERYPDYLSGWLYITSQTTAMQLVQLAQQRAIFWIDDTWVTGILRQELHIPMQSLNSWFALNATSMFCCVSDLKKYNYECEYFVGPNGGNNKLLVEFLHNVEKCYYDECIKRPLEKALNKTCNTKDVIAELMPQHGHAVVQPIKLG